MRRFVFVAALCSAFSVVLLPCLPAAARVTSKQKMITCKIGADYLKLHGAKRAHFLTRCMASVSGAHGPGAPSRH